MISVSNQWQSEIRNPPDGTQPAGGFGVTVTAGGFANTKGSWTDVFVAGDWSGFSGDAFEIEVTITAVGASGTINRLLADIGIDTGGGYSSIIDNLSGAYASLWLSNGRGVSYKFPLRIPNGCKVGCRTQSNNASLTASVEIVLRGNPTHPALVHAGTFVRTFGAVTASSTGTTITAGSVSEGAWTPIGTTADPLWYWEVGYALNDSAINNGARTIDLAAGGSGAEVKFATGFAFSLAGTETIGKTAGNGTYWRLPSSTAISAAAQLVGGAEVGEAVIIYAVGGNYELPNAATATGTVTIDGSPAANGKTVEVFARDSDGITELIGATVTGGGTGAFSLGCPDTTRSYWAKYEDGTDVGCSLEGTPGTDDLDVQINTSSGGGDCDPPTPIYGGYPTSAAATETAIGFDCSFAGGTGYLLDESAWGTCVEAFGPGDELNPQTADVPTFNLEGFLAGPDRAIGFEDSSTWRLFGFVDGVEAADDLIVATVLKLRETAAEHNVIRAGDGGLAGGIGWRLTFDGTDLKFLIRDADNDTASVAVDVSAYVDRWMVVVVALDRSAGLLRIGIAADPGTGTLGSDFDSTDPSSIGLASDEPSLTIGAGYDGLASAGFEVSALYLNRGNGIAGTVAANITDAAEDFYTTLMMGASGGGGGSGDTTPPTITIVSPTPGVAPGSPGGFSADWQIARMTPIVLEITDTAPGIEYACLVCRYPGAVDEITVYRRGAFRGSFVGSSETSITNGVRLTILPAGGWPSSDALTDISFDVDVIDGDGNLAA